jgi:hypothetical protein
MRQHVYYRSTNHHHRSSSPSKKSLQRLNNRHKTQLAENFILTFQKSQCALLAGCWAKIRLSLIVGYGCCHDGNELLALSVNGIVAFHTRTTIDNT